MANTKDEPGPFDGFETAKPGEPIFTLQGGDPLAAPLVLAWATFTRHRAGVGTPDVERFAEKLIAAAVEDGNERKRDALLLKATEAETIAWDMDDYRSGRVELAGVRARYNEDDSGTTVEEIRAAADLHAARKTAEAKLHNALAEANDVAIALVSLGGFDEEAARIGAAVKVLKDVAEKVGPARPAYMTPGGSHAADE